MHRGWSKAHAEQPVQATGITRPKRRDKGGCKEYVLWTDPPLAGCVNRRFVLIRTYRVQPVLSARVSFAHRSLNFSKRL